MEKISQASSETINLVANLNDASLPLIKFANVSPKVQYVNIAIGPEGDFTAEEIKRMKQHGFQSVNLGPNVLRAETAAIFGLSVLSAHLPN